MVSIQVHHDHIDFRNRIDGGHLEAEWRGGPWGKSERKVSELQVSMAFYIKYSNNVFEFEQ